MLAKWKQSLRFKVGLEKNISHVVFQKVLIHGIAKIKKNTTSTIAAVILSHTPVSTQFLLGYFYGVGFILLFFSFFVFFQDNQKDLEMATEILSEYLERDITSECLSDIKQKVQDKYRHVLQLAVWFYLCFLCCATFWISRTWHSMS